MANWILLLLFFTLEISTSLPVTAQEKSTPPTCIITNFGAVADGTTLNTRFIQSAIDSCSISGGTVVVPNGTFLTGAIFLKPGVNLRIEKEGMLKGSDKLEDYPEGAQSGWAVAALVNADHCDGVQLSGEGTIDGNGQRWWKLFWDLRNAKDPDLEYKARRPRLICISNSKNVRVSGLRLQNQAIWCLHLFRDENVTVDGLSIHAPAPAPSSDGIDVDSCRRVCIANCDIDVNDDCISIKSGVGAEAMKGNHPSEDIVIEKCRFGYGHGGVAIGSETSGGIRNVEVRDCVAENDNWAPIRFKSAPTRGGVVENITFHNITLRDVRRAFELNLGWGGKVKAGDTNLPVFRNLTFTNVNGTAKSGGIFVGFEGSPVMNVRFQNCNVSADKGLSIQHARNIDLSGLKLEVKEGEAVKKEDVE